jgi:CRP-like cAMP-binding protein
MANPENFWDNPALSLYTETIAEGTNLFQQGEKGTSMFIILKGTVQLIAEDNGKERGLNLLGLGEFVGEQCLISTAAYTRAFTARAKTEVHALKIGQAELGKLQKESPDLVNAILSGIFRTVAQRLQKANQVIRILRSSKNVDRLINIILYFSEIAGSTTPEGKEVFISPDSIRFYIDMSEFEIDECLKQLEKQSVIERRGTDLYLIKDEKALRESIPALENNLPQFTVI